MSSAIDEDDVIEQINGFEAEYEWRIPVLLEGGGGEERGFEAVNGAGANDAAKSAHGVASGLRVVWKVVQPALHHGRCAQAMNEPLLRRSEWELRRVDRGCVGKSLARGQGRLCRLRPPEYGFE